MRSVLIENFLIAYVDVEHSTPKLEVLTGRDDLRSLGSY